MPLNINNGVPQGLTLGPLLFLIYLSDLENNIFTNPYLEGTDIFLPNPEAKAI